MVKKAMMEVIDRLIETGLSEADACLLVAALLKEHYAENKKDEIIKKSANNYFKNKD